MLLDMPQSKVVGMIRLIATTEFRYHALAWLIRRHASAPQHFELNSGHRGLGRDAMTQQNFNARTASKSGALRNKEIHGTGFIHPR
jgi:hypothetical protein